jgi:hypothetical protein
MTSPLSEVTSFVTRLQNATWEWTPESLATFAQSLGWRYSTQAAYQEVSRRTYINSFGWRWSIYADPQGVYWCDIVLSFVTLDSLPPATSEDRLKELREEYVLVRDTLRDLLGPVLAEAEPNSQGTSRLHEEASEITQWRMRGEIFSVALFAPDPESGAWVSFMVEPGHRYSPF